MKSLEKILSICLVSSLALAPAQSYALEYKSALRPLSAALSAGAVPSEPKKRDDATLELIDKQASIKRVNELIWEWNFRILALSHQRIYLRDHGLRATRPLIGIAAIARQIEKRADTFKGVISDRAVSKLKKAAERLRRRKKDNPRVPSPNEAAANMILTFAIMPELSKAREEALKQRLSAELQRPRVFFKEGKWFVREQRYASSKMWGTSVLSYTYVQYDTLWEAFRALDHQIDTELAERAWLLDCISLLDRIMAASPTEKESLKHDIDSMLERLEKIKVEDKRLARILLQNAKILLDSDRKKQADWLLDMAKGLFKDRIAETEQIVEMLRGGRVDILRQKADRKNSFLMEKVAKILHDLKYYNYALTRIIVDEDLINGEGKRYLNEPDFAAFKDALDVISGILNRTTPLSRNDIDGVRRFFQLFHSYVVASIVTNNFMKDYRDEYVRVWLDPEAVKETHQQVFDRIFGEYPLSDQNVRKDPQLYRAILSQTAFVSPKIMRAGEREDNPEFLALSDSIMLKQADKAEIMPEGRKILLRVKDDEEKASSAGEVIDNIIDGLEKGLKSDDMRTAANAVYALFELASAHPENGLWEFVVGVLTDESPYVKPDIPDYVRLFTPRRKRVNQILQNGLYSENISTRVAAAYYFIITNIYNLGEELTFAEFDKLLSISREGLHSDDYYTVRYSAYNLLWLGAFKAAKSDEPQFSEVELLDELQDLFSLFSYGRPEDSVMLLAVADAVISYLDAARIVADSLSHPESSEDDEFTYSDYIISELIPAVCGLLIQVIEEQDIRLSEAKYHTLVILRKLIKLRVASIISEELQDKLEILLAQEADDMIIAFQKELGELRRLKIEQADEDIIQAKQNIVDSLAAALACIDDEMDGQLAKGLFDVLHRSVLGSACRLMMGPDKEQALRELRFAEDGFRNLIIRPIGPMTYRLVDDTRERIENPFLHVFATYILAGTFPIALTDAYIEPRLALILNEGLRSDEPAIAAMAAMAAIRIAEYRDNLEKEKTRATVEIAGDDKRLARTDTGVVIVPIREGTKSGPVTLSVEFAVASIDSSA